MVAIPSTSGDDLRNGTNARDTFAASAGDDKINSLGGDDALNGGTGDDELNGGSGSDTLNGGFDDDLLGGGRGNDRLIGDSGDDELKGGAGADRLEGGSGDDLLRGGSGVDTLQGGSGDDTLNGGSGADTLIGGSEVTGGGGLDTFVYDIADHTNIEDFFPAAFQGDRIQLLGFITADNVNAIAASGGEPDQIDDGDQGVVALPDGGDRFGGLIVIDFADVLGGELNGGVLTVEGVSALFPSSVGDDIFLI